MKVDNETEYRCDRTEFKRNLRRRMKPLLASHEVDAEMAADAVERAFDGIGKDYDDLQSRFLSLTLWYIFAGDVFWIDCRTKAGNAVTDDVMLAAYAVWRDAADFAGNCGADIVSAALALDKAAQSTADAISKGRPVEDARKYMFAAYRNRILRQQRFLRKSVEITDRDTSDGGAFSAAVENKVLAHELVAAMTRHERAVAMMRYHLDYDWRKIAGILGTSVNAAQKALSFGQRKARAFCREDSAAKKMKKRKRRKPE